MNTWFYQHRRALGRALYRFWHAPLSSLLSALVIGISLALPTGGHLLVGNVAALAGNLSATPQISVFMSAEATPEQVAEVSQKLRQTAQVSHVRHVPREETLARLKQSEGMRDVLESLPRNPFPDTLIVTPGGSDPALFERLASGFAKLPRVEQVQVDSEWIKRLHALLSLGEALVWLLGAMLAVALVVIVFNTIRLQILTQRQEIGVTRLLGATDSFIRRPFYYFGALQGLLGGFVALALIVCAITLLRAPMGEALQAFGLSVELQGPEMADSLALLGIATAIGWLGAAISLRQNLERDSAGGA